MNGSLTQHTGICNATDSLAYQLNFYAQILNLILGLPVHSFLVWLILSGAGTHESSDIFHLNQGVVEILYCLSAPLSLVGITCDNQVYMARAFFGGLFLSSRPLFQMCICVERYLAVLHPMLFLRFRPLRYRVALSAVVWLLILGVCLGTMLSLPFYLYEMYGTLFLLVLTVDLFCCLSVVWALKRPGPGSRGGEPGHKRNDRVSVAVKKKAIKIILFNCLSLMVHITPVSIICILSAAIKSDFYVSMTLGMIVIIAIGFIQHIIYIYRARKIKCFIKCF